MDLGKRESVDIEKSRGKRGCGWDILHERRINEKGKFEKLGGYWALMLRQIKNAIKTESSFSP